MKRTILLNGAIRDTEELYLILDFILAQREEYRSEIPVIVSTWQSDIQRFSDFVNHFSSLSVQFISVPDVAVGGPANIYRQWRTMEAGIGYIPTDHIVLKGRTDKFLLRKDIISAFIRGSFKSEQFLSEHLLSVEHITTSLPFMAKDMIFMGTVQAIRKILHYSVRTSMVADHIYNGIGPECFLWLEFAKMDHNIMSMIQKIDFRSLSNSMVEDSRFFEKDNNILYLYHKWIEVFEKELCFISDVLECEERQPWLIDEGTWKYQIGDRTAYNDLKAHVTLHQPYAPEIMEAENLNGAHRYLPRTSEIEVYNHPFPGLQESIHTEYSPERSDIVLIRIQIITQELGKEQPNVSILQKALHWNIRQRDRSTLDMVYEWIMQKSPKLEYVDPSDRIFVIERIVDFFTFSNDQVSIDKTISTVPELFKSTALLRTRVAEYYFHHRLLWKALYWFYLSSRMDDTNLGVNHGIGCTLLDLGYPRLANRFLKKAHKISPFDQTAIFTLLRSFALIDNQKEALRLSELLTGHLHHEANKILTQCYA